MKRKIDSKRKTIKKIKLSKEDTTDCNGEEKTKKTGSISNGNLKADVIGKSQENIPNLDIDSVNLIKLENLMSDSNHFLEMQISELLIRRRLSKKTINSLKFFLLSFKKILKTTYPLSVNLDKIVCPLDEMNETFNYQLPKKIHFSYPLQTVLLNEATFINIIIQIPKMCIHSKDYLNEGYFRRRAQFLKHIVAVLYSLPTLCDLKFCFDFDMQKPTITFSSSEFKQYRIEFIIETSIGDVFKVSRFISNTNNLRKKYYKEVYKFAVPDEVESLISNPYYDSCILKDMLITEHRRYYKKSLKDKNNFYDAIILIKLWISKRQISLSLLYDVAISFILYLWEKNKINEQMTVLTILKIFFTSLAKSNWNKEGIFFNNSASKNLVSFDFFEKNFEIIFTDKSGNFNLCYDWNIYQYNSLLHEAKITSELIYSEANDKFRQIFSDTITFYEKFDYIFQINTDVLKNVFTQSKKLSPNLMNLCGDFIKLANFQILNILKKGLGKRIVILNCKDNKYLFSPNIRPSYPQGEFQTFGVLIDKTYASAMEERGPVANTDEAVEFLKFWGEISEQYHHPGESVCEVVKWKCKNFLERRLIIMKIIKHLLQRHFNIPKKLLIFYGQQLDTIMQSSVSCTPGSKESIGSGEEIHDHVIRLIDSLSKLLRSIPDLPLPINSVQGLSPIFRYTEEVPYTTTACEYTKTYLVGNCAAPMVYFVPPFKPYYEVLCMLEGSGKWPDDREAVKRLKSAFYIKLAPILKIHNYSIKVHPSFIDAIPSNTSVIFRMKVGFLQEISLCKKTILDDGKIMMVENDESRKMEKRLVTLPKLTSTLHGLQQQHNTYGYVSRLCKRWVSAQLLSQQFPPEVIELIVAHLYVSPRCLSAPCSQMSGFLQFLHLVSNFDWNLQPLIVNLNNKFTQADIQDIELYFSNNKNINQSIFISYPDDKFSQKWTDKIPTKQALRRLIAVATASLLAIEHLIKIHLHSIDDFKKVFRPPIKDFDIIINLISNLCPRYAESIDYNSSKNKQIEKLFFNSSNLYPVVNFDPVQIYISDLETVLGEFLTFFNDKNGGIVIAGVWKKSSFKPIIFDEEQLELRKISDKKSEEGLMIPCLDKITDKIKLLGKGIVFDVIVMNKMSFNL